MSEEQFEQLMRFVWRTLPIWMLAAMVLGYAYGKAVHP